MRTTAGAFGTAASVACSGDRRDVAAGTQPAGESSALFRGLTPMTAGITPIGADERRARVEKARRLMSDHGMQAIFLEGGSSLFYYTGVRWGLSERVFGLVIPVRGEPAWIVPAFEEQRAWEVIASASDLRVWQEDESPYAVVSGILRDRGIASGTIGLEEHVRFFVFDGLRQQTRASYVSATPVTAGGRMFKSAAEIALMQRANDITVRAMDAALRMLREDMTQTEVAAGFAAAATALGGDGGGALVAFGKETAFPHGSSRPQQLREGDVVLIDGGCTVHGYTADITRTTVFGTATARQRDVWELEKRAQSAAVNAAQPGATCAAVDAAARAVITAAGFGPGYRLPGLPHRTGHGIGLDGHEWTHFVAGNETTVAPGMCFSAEPTIAIYGEFGIRLEDCLYITESGPRLFTRQSESIEKPFG